MESKSHDFMVVDSILRLAGSGLLDLLCSVILSVLLDSQPFSSAVVLHLFRCILFRFWLDENAPLQVCAGITSPDISSYPTISIVCSDPFP